MGSGLKHRVLLVCRLYRYLRENLGKYDVSLVTIDANIRVAIDEESEKRCVSMEIQNLRQLSN